jgi:hypothetical protein
MALPRIPLTASLTHSHARIRRGGARSRTSDWLVDDKNLAGLKASGVKVKMIGVDISPVLDRGVQWCRNQR